MENLLIKVWFEREKGGEPEIRRFSVPHDVDSTYNYVHDKVVDIFSVLEPGQFNMYWKDADGDLVIFSSQEEFVEALNSARDSASDIKLVVKEAKASNKRVRVTAPEGNGRPRRAMRKGVDTNTGIIPPRSGNRWMRRPRAMWQQEEATACAEPANNRKETTTNDETENTSDSCGSDFRKRSPGWRLHGMWQPERAGQCRHRRRYGNIERHHDHADTALLSDEGLTENVKESRPPLMKPSLRALRRRQQLLQELQCEAGFAGPRSGFNPSWRNERRADNFMACDMSCRGFQGNDALTDGFRWVRAGRFNKRFGNMAEKTKTSQEQVDSATGFEYCPQVFKRGAWRRMNRSLDLPSEDSFASCQRRRARRMRREAMMWKTGGFEERCKRGRVNVDSDGILWCPNHRDTVEDEENGNTPDETQTKNTTKTSVTGIKRTNMVGLQGMRIKRRLGYSAQHSRGKRCDSQKHCTMNKDTSDKVGRHTNQQGLCPRKRAFKIAEMKTQRVPGDTYSSLMSIFQRKGNAQSAYRLRVLRRLRRLGYLKALTKPNCHEPRHGFGGHMMRRGAFKMFPQTVLSGQKRPFGGLMGKRLRRGSRPGSVQVQAHRFRRFHPLARGGRKMTGIYLGPKNQGGVQCILKPSSGGNTMNNRWRRIVKMWMRQGNQLPNGCQRFSDAAQQASWYQKNRCPPLGRNADIQHVMKIVLEKQKRKEGFGGPRCGRRVRIGYGPRPYRHLHNRRANLIARLI